MRIEAVVLLVPAFLAAQPQPASLAMVRGILLERDPQTASGEFSVRRDDNMVLRYRFDSETYVERDQELMAVSRLRPGEEVEVISDEGPATSLRYARTVHVIEDPPPQRRLPERRAPLATSAYRSSLEGLLPPSTLSFSGVVFRLNEGRVAIHTHEAGDQTILLRQDTRYLEDGATVAAKDLHPNMRVFVRAVRNLYDEIEAYQIIWGHILLPH
jgi:hypothetical protein